MKRLVKMAIAAAMAGMGFASYAAAVIDDFSTSQSLITDGSINNSGVYSEACGVGIIGGCRDMFVSRQGGANTSGFISLEAAGGVMNFNQDTRTGGIGVIRWDGDTGTAGSNAAVNVSEQDFLAGPLGTYLNPTGLLGQNLTSLGNAFAITTLFADGNFNFVLTAYTNGLKYSTLALQAIAVPDGDPPTTFYIPFAAFAFGNCGPGGCVDFTNIGALEATLNPDLSGVFGPNFVQRNGTDVTLDIVEVPEPGTIALAGLALLGLGVVRRRKQ